MKKCCHVAAVLFVTNILHIGTVITFLATLDTFHIQEALIATELVVDVWSHMIKHASQIPIASALRLPAVPVTGNMVDICQGRL